MTKQEQIREEITKILRCETDVVCSALTNEDVCDECRTSQILAYLSTQVDEVSITGIEGLKVFLTMLQHSWALGEEITFSVKARFVPNGKELIHYEVSPLMEEK